MSHIRHHTLRFLKNVLPDGQFATGPDAPSPVDHILLASYDCGEVPPFVPAVRSFFRFHDHEPPGMPVDHRETAGWIESVVTVHYGTRVIIEVYINPRKR